MLISGNDDSMVIYPYLRSTTMLVTVNETDVTKSKQWNVLCPVCKIHLMIIITRTIEMCKYKHGLYLHINFVSDLPKPTSYFKYLQLTSALCHQHIPIVVTLHDVCINCLHRKRILRNTYDALCPSVLARECYYMCVSSFICA